MAGEMPDRIWVTPLGEPDGGFWYSPCTDKSDKTEYVLASTHQRALEALRERVRARFTPGDSYDMRAEDFHTIRIAMNETVLMLLQKEDVVPLDKPTLTFTRDREPPSLDGLYSRFTADEVVKILGNFEDRVGNGFRFCQLPETTPGGDDGR